MLGCVVGGAGTGLWVKFDFGSARSTVVRDRPDLGYSMKVQLQNQNSRQGLMVQSISKPNLHPSGRIGGDS